MKHVVPNDDMFDAAVDAELGARPFPDESGEQQRSFDPDQPRDPDGKFASGGGEAPGKGTPPEMLRPDMTSIEQQGAIIRNRARELDFPVEKVVVLGGSGREFTVGGVSFREGGHAEIYTTGNIVLYPEGMHEESLGGLVAHEVEHVRFQGVLADYNSEMGHLHDWALNDREQYDKVTDPAGYLDPEKGAGAVLPAATVLSPMLDKNIDQLVKDDGVTAYSNAYWNAVSSPESIAKYGGYKESRERAIHETLAEMARIKFEHGSLTGEHPGVLKPTKIWRDLFSSVNKLAKEKGYGYVK